MQHLPFETVFSDESGGNTKTPQSEYKASGLYPIIDQGKELIGGYTDDASRICGKGKSAIIFGDHTRILKYADFPFCMGADGVKILRPKIEANLKYLYHQLKSLHLPSAGYDRHFKYLKRTAVALPSIEEQHRIAAILDQADALRAKRREALAELDGLAQAIFVEMFDGDLKALRRTTLADVVTEFRYGTSEKSGPSGFPALRIPNIASGQLDLKELKTVPATTAEFERLRLKNGDLLFVRTNGNPDQVGRCAVFDTTLVEETNFEPTEFIYASYLIRARIKPNLIHPAVLQQYLSEGEGRQALRARCKTSAGQYNINTESLGSIPVPILQPEAQQLFVKRIQALESLKATHRTALTELDALFASLQHRAFRGEL